MKTLHFWFLAVAFFLPSFAHAAVSGVWKGTGPWGYEGSAVDCKMTMEYREDEAELRRKGGKFDCGFVGLSSDPLTWKKEAGGNLSLGGSPAGTISEAGFNAVEDYEGGVTVHTKFAYQGNSGSYEERWINKDGSEIYVITGQLTRGQ